MGGPVTKEKLESLLGEINKLENIDPADTTTKELMKEFAPNQYEMVYGTTKGDGRWATNLYPTKSDIKCR